MNLHEIFSASWCLGGLKVVFRSQAQTPYDCGFAAKVRIFLKRLRISWKSHRATAIAFYGSMATEASGYPMPNIERSDPRLPDRDPTNAVTRFKSKAIRWELWLSVVAAVSLILVVSGGLLTLAVEMRSGWASDHEVQMDKAAAIHKLLFRR